MLASWWACALWDLLAFKWARVGHPLLICIVLPAFTAELPAESRHHVLQSWTEHGGRDVQQ